MIIRNASQEHYLFQRWKLTIAHSPRQAPKHLGQVRIADFLLQFLKLLARLQVLKKLSFQPCISKFQKIHQLHIKLNSQ